MKRDNASVTGPVLHMLGTIVSYPEDRFEEVSLNSWAVYAIYVLSGIGIPATKETITVVLFRMYPSKWSLVGFPEYPDSERVNRALLQLRPKYRNWADGDSQLGWTLNDEGRREAERMEGLLATGNEQPPSGQTGKPQRPRTRMIDQSLRELEDSRLYRLYIQNQPEKASRFDLWACFGATGLTPPAALENTRRELLRQARTLERDDLVKFLDWVKARFGRYFQK